MSSWQARSAARQACENPDNGFVSDGTRVVSYAYSTAGDLTTITDVMGGTVSYQYSGHLLT